LYATSGSLSTAGVVTEALEISTALNIYAYVLAEHMEQFERQRATILGTKRAPEKRRRAPGRVISMRGLEQPSCSSGKYRDDLRDRDENDAVE
jgi:hypothetical protein